MIWLLATMGCGTDDWVAPIPPPVELGAPRVGAAEGYLALPVGTPLGGYTARCTCLGGVLAQADDRDSPYTTAFIESAGVQTYPTIKVIWLDNGDDHLVLTKTDTIYSDDQLVRALTERLEAETGLALAGRVVHTTNHSHGSYGDFAQGASWYLGTDRFNREIFDRFVDQLATVALAARDDVQDAKIGVGWTTDWDPDDRVYRDRRGENDDLQIWGSDSPVLGKDPHLGVIRFDRLDDTPIAMLLNFGMHGILGGEDNPMVSTDSGGHLEVAVEEAFDEPMVVMFTQGSGGDASPAGSQDDFARMESIGVRAVDAIIEAWGRVPTSADPIALDSVSQHVVKHPSVIEVTRDGTVDWRYAPYEEGRFADGEVYDDEGGLVSPIDEFNTRNGGVFCGSGDLALPVGGLGAPVFPYSQCLDVELLSVLIDVFFQLDGDIALPLPESLRAGTTVSRLGPVPTLRADGTEISQDLLVGFFPGEPVYSFVEQWRRRAEAELGLPQAMAVGYSQDHEGYLLPPEDWLVGGYEPDISLWGPLEAEYIMERMLDYSDTYLSTDVREDPDPLGLFGPTEFPEVPLPTQAPDLTAAAGTRITEAQPYLWTPWINFDNENAPQSPSTADLEIPETVPRVQGMVQIAWEGGDPMVDAPKVVLEREEDGTWAPVRSRSGRIIDEGRHDILLAHTPTPRFPSTDPQTHAWWAVWQAVGHVHDRAGLPLGRYRLRVTGTHYAGTAETWPWDSTPYEVVSEAFTLVPAVLTVDDQTEGQGGLRVAIDAPNRGYRFVADGGDEDGLNPVMGPVTVTITTPTGDEVVKSIAPPMLSTADAALVGSSWLDVALPTDWTTVTVVDGDGNEGTFEAPFTP